MEATAKDILSRAREILTPPEAWTQGASGRDAEGYACNVHLPRACSFCLMGAVAKAQGELKGSVEAGAGAYQTLNRVVGREERLDLFNDDPQRTHSEILEVFDDAIARTS